VITQHQFYLSVYCNQEESDTPAHFFVLLDVAKATYFLRRISLLENIKKVDPLIETMIYRNDDGVYYFETNGENDPTPVLSTEATSITAMRVHVDEEGIWWNAYHDSSGNEITTNKLERYALENLSKGLNPFEIQHLPQGETYLSTIQGFVGEASAPVTIPPLPSAPNPLHQLFVDAGQVQGSWVEPQGNAPGEAEDIEEDEPADHDDTDDGPEPDLNNE
jgi:hypothetical protein